jgi:hypothetical protein
VDERQVGRSDGPVICRCGHGWEDHIDTGRCWCGCPEMREDVHRQHRQRHSGVQRQGQVARGIA